MITWSIWSMDMSAVARAAFTGPTTLGGNIKWGRKKWGKEEKNEEEYCYLGRRSAPSSSSLSLLTGSLKSMSSITFSIWARRREEEEKRTGEE